ncbi:Non-repetitive/WGA-negative nucleoporin C-terminal-domain-containing protein [Paraphysoderma sedebokerense]|nr:Non-repetitive/WGA-negative nucleoporin C-terminal-domain-containing protein [Paraphysoderma sedebokerense]
MIQPSFGYSDQSAPSNQPPILSSPISPLTKNPSLISPLSQQKRARDLPQNPEVLLNTLKTASTVLDDQLVKDAKFPDLADLFGATTASSEYIPTIPDRAPVYLKQKVVPIPDSLYSQYDLSQCTVYMGLFPEINRAWITFDNRLYLWNYVHGSDSYCYDKQDEIITAVALVKPKSNVFLEKITHLLVFSTPSLIHILAVSYSSQPNIAPLSPSSARAAFKPDETDLEMFEFGMTFSTEGITMTSIVGTPNGRIFMCGNDGHLHEIVYESGSSWTSILRNKRRKVNLTQSIQSYFIPTFLQFGQEDKIAQIYVDCERNLLFLLHVSSAIQIISLGSDGTKFDKIGKIDDIKKSVETIAPSAQGREFKITKIFGVSTKESKSIGLVAVTTTGNRLYFSIAHGHLSLRYVRLPPAQLQNAATSPYRYQQLQYQQAPPLTIDDMYYSTGSSLMVNSIAEDNDALIGVSLDVGGVIQSATPSVLMRNQFREMVNVTQIDGKAWAIAEISPTTPMTRSRSRTATAVKSPGGGLVGIPGDASTAQSDFLEMNELATQVTKPARSFLVLSNSSLALFVKQRPVDLLRQLIMDAPNADSSDIRKFFEHYGVDQACAMCLAIACNNPYSTLNVQSMASGTIPNAPPVSAPVVAGAKRLFFEFGGRPTLHTSSSQSSRSDIARPVNPPEIHFSGKHNGLALYIGRLVRPIWREKLVLRGAARAGTKLNVTDITLMAVQQTLQELRKFIDSNPQLVSSSSEIDFARVPVAREEIEALQAERASLYGVSQLLTQTIEAISFVLLMIDYRLPELVERLPYHVQSDVSDLTYEHLITTPKGRTLCRELVSLVIQEQILGPHLTTADSLSTVLEKRCPTFCTPDDVILYKAIELLRQAGDTPTPSDREHYLRECLKFFCRVAGSTSIEQIATWCDQFKNLNFHIGAIELALCCANESDPTNAGLAYYQDRCPPNDPRIEFFTRRERCYEIALDILGDVNQQLNQSEMQFDLRNGRHFADDVERYRDTIFDRALSSEDALFHTFLYEWYLSQGLIQPLLEIKSTYIEAFLKTEFETGPIERAELLWQFYARNNQFAQAAEVLSSLADSTRFKDDFDLSKRIEYLSQAFVQMQSVLTGAASDAQRLSLIKDKLDVANIQLEVLSSMKNMPDQTEAVKALNERLFVMSELYNDYALRYNLLELQLVIINSASYKDEPTVSGIWDKIINEVMTSTEGRPIDTLPLKIAELGGRFHPSEYVFSMSMIIPKLETVSLKYASQGGVQGWVVKTLKSVGVSYDVMFDVFDTMYDSKTAPWNSKDAQVFLLSDILILLQDWFDYVTQPTADPIERARFPAKSVDEAITKYLDNLKTASTQSLVNSFQEVQRQLKRRF